MTTNTNFPNTNVLYPLCQVVLKKKKKSTTINKNNLYPPLLLRFFLGAAKPKPCLNTRKFSSGAVLKWHTLIEGMTAVSGSSLGLSKLRPRWALHGSGVCRGRAGSSWQDPPQVPGSCQDEENSLCRHTVTGADAVLHVRHSFHFLHHCHWFPGQGDISDTLF